ncbi:Phosphinothricin N-acetyltransferase [Bifidobacterium longum subsp. longum]|nr:Phosphinothricin N-acetyltransferase [Bifidobacterium longum subsp. longum]
MPYTFRPAVESDVQAIADIYNASVMAGGATADLTPRTFDQRRAWVESHTPPYGVFVVESEDGSIIGFGALSVFYDRAGYDGVTDLAYYIDPAWQGRGVGTFMLDRLLTEALARHMRKACGIIFADTPAPLPSCTASASPNSDSCPPLPPTPPAPCGTCPTGIWTCSLAVSHFSQEKCEDAGANELDGGVEYNLDGWIRPGMGQCARRTRA